MWQGKIFSFVCAAAASAVLLVASPGTAFAQSREIENAAANYRHTGTGTLFPVKIGEFDRTKVVEYNDDGSDASASYDLIRGGKKIMSATVFIYPMDGSSSVSERDTLCRDEYANIKNAIAKSYKDVVVKKEDVPGTPSPRVSATGLHASYTFTGNFAGTDMTLKSEAYLYCPAGGKWFVQYRATWPVAMALDNDVYTLMSGLPWSEEVSR